jgi:hypothetical protein
MHALKKFALCVIIIILRLVFSGFGLQSLCHDIQQIDRFVFNLSYRNALRLVILLNGATVVRFFSRFSFRKVLNYGTLLSESIVRIIFKFSFRNFTYLHDTLNLLEGRMSLLDNVTKTFTLFSFDEPSILHLLILIDLLFYSIYFLRRKDLSLLIFRHLGQSSLLLL